MPSTRRTLLIAATSAIVPAVLRPGAARAEDPRETPRFMGSPDAKVTATEWYSMTCPHCARFAAEVFPQIKAQLIDTGKLKYVFGDFPLDQLALTAAMVARTLPADRYEPFVMSLLSSQMQWAYGSGNHTEQLFARAAIAGMSRATFDAAMQDQGLRDWILTEQKAAQDKYSVDSTPTFIVGLRKASGEISFDAFNQLVQSASS
ncbi:MAG TPA: thioredoxin domain-containing protein [Acidisphaera sp.]|nr:thioredoxin domain-containing protein [Acidisphaera sp.]